MMCGVPLFFCNSDGNSREIVNEEKFHNKTRSVYNNTYQLRVLFTI